MGAMLALGVVHVDDVVILIHIVVAVGHLAVDIGLPGVDGNVQLLCDGGNLLGIQQLQTGHIVLSAHADAPGPFSQGILEGGRIKGLMVHVRTGIDDGDAGASAGVTGSPGSAGADL